MVNYKAIIEGREREVCGWSGAGTLLLADGEEIALTALDQEQLSGKIWRVARLKFENNDWRMDGESLADARKDALSRSIMAVSKESRELESQHFETLNHLFGTLNRDFSERETVWERVGWRRAWRSKLTRVVGVAWSEDSMASGEPERPIRFYIPILLTRFDFIVSSQRPATANDTYPDYFLTYADAARYAKVEPRTIQNWIKRDWLRVERVGRKIRITRADLDKCKKGQ